MTEDAIDTPRLRGERPEPADTGFYRALFGDSRVAATLWPGALGGPRDVDQADALLASDIAHWERHGFGPWVSPSGRAGGRRRAPASSGPAWTAARRWRSSTRCPRTENRASRRVTERTGLRPDHLIDHAGLPHLLFRTEV